MKIVWFESRLFEMRSSIVVSMECMKRRVISCIVQKGGRASKPEIISNTTGARARLIRIMESLVDAGTILKDGKGTKGSPHVFTVVEVFHSKASEVDDCLVTVTI